MKDYDGNKTLQEYEINQAGTRANQSSAPPVEFPRFDLQGSVGKTTPSSVNTRDLLSIERNLAEIGTTVNQHSDVLERIQEKMHLRDRDDTQKVSTTAVIVERVEALQRWKTFLVTTSVALLLSFIGMLGLASKIIWDASAGDSRLSNLAVKAVSTEQSLKTVEEAERELERRLDRIGSSKSGDDFMSFVSSMTKEQERVIMLMLCPTEPTTPGKRSPSR